MRATDRCFYLTWHHVFVHARHIDSKSMHTFITYHTEYEMDGCDGIAALPANAQKNGKDRTMLLSFRRQYTEM